MDVNKVKFRCSQLGLIMTDPRGGSGLTDKQQEELQKLSKLDKLTDNQQEKLDYLLDKQANPRLSETCARYLSELYVNLRYGRKKDITNKYIEKGLAVEEDSLTVYSRVHKLPFFKNQDQFEDDYITGTPDQIGAEDVLDIKSSWDIFTFFNTLKEDLNEKYYWQLQGYMSLTGRRSGRLAYCLVNTPDSLVNDEKRRAAWRMGLIDADASPLYKAVCEEIEKLSVYDDIPLKERVNEIKIPYDALAIERLHLRIDQCRKYMAGTWPEFFRTKDFATTQEF